MSWQHLVDLPCGPFTTKTKEAVVLHKSSLHLPKLKWEHVHLFQDEGGSGCTRCIAVKDVCTLTQYKPNVCM